MGKTVIKDLGMCGFGLGSNTAMIDVENDFITRIRPLRFSSNYEKEDLNYWTLEKDGHVFEPGFKTLLPPLSLAYKKRTYSPNRIPCPLIRVDFDPNGERNIQNRGVSKYRRASWDEACSIIASEVKRIQETYGVYSILTQGDGHGESKNYAGSHGCMAALLDLTGGCLKQARQPDSWEGWYWGAKHIWGMDPSGQNKYQNGVFRDITENGDAILFWGADPETTPWGWGGQQPSRMCYWFNEIGINSIFISPDLNYAAAVHADKWIPVYPNTDSALQLSIAYIWLSEESYDKEYIATHADGFDWFKYHVMGGDDGIPKTPEWAEEKCGVPVRQIKALARYWAKSRVSIAHCNGGGFIRSAFSHEPARLEVALLGMQGVGKPGANQFKFIEWTLFGVEGYSPLPRCEVWPSTEGAYHGANFDLNPAFLIKTKVPQAILNPPVTWWGHGNCSYPRKDQYNKYSYPYQEGDKVYDPIHMIFSDAPCWETCWNGGFKFEDALRHESIEFIAVQHPWMENGALFADVILPAATLMECDDVGSDNFSGQFALFYLGEQAVSLQGDVLSDFEGIVEIAKHLEKFGGVYENLSERYTEGLAAWDVMKRGFEKSGIPDDFTWEDFIEKKFWASPIREGWETEPAGMIEFYEDPENHPLDTKTGKIEYYSTELASVFPDDQVRGPYPKWIDETKEHKDRLSSDRASEYPFLLVSNHPRWRVHANHDDISWLREIPTCKVVGPDGYRYEPIWVNPRDAQKLDIQQGDVLRIYNERGSVLGAAYITERIMENVVYQDHGARVDAIVPGSGGIDRGGANNLIAPSDVTSAHAAGEVTSGFLVGVEKVDISELASEYPEAFSRTYDIGAGLIVDAYIAEP